MLLALPRARWPSRPLPAQPRAPARTEAASGTRTSFWRMLRRGALSPPQSTRARISQIFGSGSVGSEMQPKSHGTEPAQIRTSTHTDVAAACRARARGLGGAAARDRLLKVRRKLNGRCAVCGAAAGSGPGVASRGRDPVGGVRGRTGTGRERRDLLCAAGRVWQTGGAFRSRAFRPCRRAVAGPVFGGGSPGCPWRSQRHRRTPKRTFRG